MKQVTLPGPGRACPACRKHRNSLAAAGPEVAAHVAPCCRPTRRPPARAAARMKSTTSEPPGSGSDRPPPERAGRGRAMPMAAPSISTDRRDGTIEREARSERSISTSADDAAGDRLRSTSSARQAHLAHRARLAARRQDRERRRRRAHGAALRRRQQRPASAGADRQRRPDPRRRRQGARRRDADRVAGQALASCPTCASTRSRSTSAGSPT